MLRVGKEGIVSFPNFGYWRNRLQVLSGHMPVTPGLPYQWYDTPNIHLCTLRDFEALCSQHHINILERRVMNSNKKSGYCLVFWERSLFIGSAARMAMNIDNRPAQKSVNRVASMISSCGTSKYFQGLLP